jgi:aromatic-L-amino-acid decarboxylase
MDWGVRLLSLDDKFLTKSGVGGGVIQVRPSCGHWYPFLTLKKTTASDVALVACIAARTRYTKKHPNAKHENLVIYGTTQTHSLGAKSALALGLQFRALEVRKEDGYALKGATLEQALKEDHEAGREPFVISKSLCVPLLDDHYSPRGCSWNRWNHFVGSR